MGPLGYHTMRSTVAVTMVTIGYYVVTIAVSMATCTTWLPRLPSNYYEVTIVTTGYYGVTIMVTMRLLWGYHGYDQATTAYNEVTMWLPWLL